MAEEYNKMTQQKRAEYLFKKFKIAFDGWNCNDGKYSSVDACIENRLVELRLKYSPESREDRIARDLYATLCNNYSEANS